MSDKENDKLDKILGKLDDHAEQLRTIQTGIYGDEKNGFPGLMKENKDQEKRIKELEEFKKKGIYVVSGFSTAASFGIPWLIEWVKQKLGG